MGRYDAEEAKRIDPFRMACIIQDILCELVMLADAYPDNAQLDLAVRQTEQLLGRAIGARRVH